MSYPKLLIIGGGLAGLSTGCYARENDFDVTIVEHNLALGGVCTAWNRGPYLIDGCIHWLTGGPFLQLYEELSIVPAVPLRTIDEFVMYRHASEGWHASLRRDLQHTLDELRALAPEDSDELARLVEGAAHVADLNPNVARPPELAGMSDRLRDLWQLRHDIGTMVHFRKPLGVWVEEHLKSPRLRAVLLHVMPPEAPTLFLLLVLGYLSRGWLSRPVGGTARFRDALVDHYRALGGQELLNTTVEEVLVANGRATGVRLTDGTMIDADMVVSTASAPETVFRLLAGRYGASEWKTRMEQWKMFQPIVLASFGVARSFEREPSTLLIDGIDPLIIGDFHNTYLYLRIYNEDSAFAPPGHTVVQAMLPTEYDWWATRGVLYQQEKDDTTERVLTCIDRYLPGVKTHARVADLATPLTYWRNARAWRGAFEGWLPSSNAFKHVSKQLPGLEGFYMAGQWVEPGGGVPVAVMSGRHVVEIMCANLGRAFTNGRSRERTAGAVPH
jgi:phytoene dehydrogenase-like protein